MDCTKLFEDRGVKRSKIYHASFRPVELYGQILPTPRWALDKVMARRKLAAAIDSVLEVQSPSTVSWQKINDCKWHRILF